MKASHFFSRFAFGIPAMAGLLLSGSLSVAAQENTTRETIKPAPPQSNEVSSPAPPPDLSRRGSSVSGRTVIPELNISDGQNLTGLVEILSSLTGANFVVEESLKRMSIPALKLRNVTVTSVLDVVRMTAKDRIVVSYSDDRPPAAQVVTIVPSTRDRQDSKQKKICRVFRLPDPARSRLVGRPSAFGAAPDAEDAVTEEEKAKKAVLAQENARKGLTEIVEQISAATRQACSSLAAANGEPKAEADYPKIEVHAATRLVIVTGNPADVDLAAQIIGGVGGFLLPSPNDASAKSSGESRSIRGLLDK